MGVGNFKYSSKPDGNKMGDGKMTGKMGGGKMGSYAPGGEGKSGYSAPKSTPASDKSDKPGGGY
jgi:hypothetical protein